MPGMSASKDLIIYEAVLSGSSLDRLMLLLVSDCLSQSPRTVQGA
jgi:hypothetical protein